MVCSYYRLPSDCWTTDQTLIARKKEEKMKKKKEAWEWAVEMEKMG